MAGEASQEAPLSVEKRIRNGTASYLVRWRDTAGAQRSRSFERKSEATSYDAEINRQRRRALIDPRLGRITIGDFAEMWLSWQTQLKPKTLAGYRSLLDNQVLPYWRGVRLDEVNYAAASEWVSALCHMPGRGDESLSPSRVRQAYHLFTGMLDGAVAARWLPANAARGVALPTVADRKNRRALTIEEVADLADACGPHRLMVLLMAYTGLRWGEVAGLRVTDVYVDRAERKSSLDLGGRVKLHVAQTVSDVNGTLVVGTPKSHQRRSVDVPGFLEADLIARIAAKTPSDLIFSSRSGGPLRVGNFRRDWFDKAARTLGLPRLTPHELRHTAATLAIASGATIRDIQSMFGHKDAGLVLRRYGSHNDEAASRLAERMSRAAEDAREQRRTSRRPNAV